MVRSLRLAAGVSVLALVAVGCMHGLAPPSAAPSGNQAPVALRNLQVTSVEGHRALLLRLSRLPNMVRQTSGKDPGRIVIEAWGPVGDGDLPERTLPQIDPEISDVRVSRHDGALQITVDFKNIEPPPYSVHEMADWIMVRFGAPQEG